MELIDVVYDAQRKSEKFSNETMNFIVNPKNSKSTKIYERYQKQFIRYYKNNKIRNEASQIILVNYFSMIATTEKYSLETMWYICTCLKSYIMVKYNTNIKSIMCLCKAIKRFTQDRIVSKPDIFLYSKIKLGLQALFNKDKDKDLL